MSKNVNRKRLLAAGLFILIIIVVICAVVLGGTGGGAKELTYDEAKAKLLKLMADAPEIADTYIDDEGTSHDTQEIRIFDGQDFRTGSVYNFTFRYNGNVEGMEDRLAGDYAISLDGEHIYYYNQAEDYHVEYTAK